ncbi:hypothetical protein C1J00_13585 [Streptomyces cahuitamycinicus]|uniref:Uncharacterized protein n=1 Tax=Streptomyces cahuitamycinicus TaxID=2070367 RepID=A0A2N8TRR7_9ACTN|nr:hypothetical protein C1J00_13585 [Streptomyces cahuitamycinicus]
MSTVRWAADAPTEPEFGVRRTLAGFPDGALAVHLEDGRGGTAVFPAHASPSGTEFVVRVPINGGRRLGRAGPLRAVRLAEPPAGLWAGQLRLGGWSWGLPPTPADLVPAKWRRRGLPWHAKPAADRGETFTLQVARTDLVRTVAHRLKP